MADGKWEKLYKQEAEHTAAVADSLRTGRGLSLQEVQVSLLIEVVANLRVIRQYLIEEGDSE